MAWLGAALAFAITMLALSTVVTTTVETIHRIIGLREKGLKLMLEHFYDAAIAPHVERELPPSGTHRNDFLATMTANRAPVGNAGFDSTFLSWIWGGRQLGSLSLEDFMARLGDSHFGDAVAQVQSVGGATSLDVVLQDLAHKFESFGRDASEYFQARARLVSILVAFVIGWQCYVNPFVLASTFLRDPNVTAAVVATGPAYVEKSKQVDESVRRAATGEPQPTGAQAVPAQPANGDGKTAADGKQEGTGVSFDKAQQQLDQLLALGVPIGWTEARLEAAGFAHTPHWLIYPASFPKAYPTIAWLLLGGLLVGLGSPFWRDAVLSLTAFRDGAKTATAAAVAIGRDPVVVATERFLTASQARAVGNAANAESATDVAVG
jgi:hypothetical protein